MTSYEKLLHHYSDTDHRGAVGTREKNNYTTATAATTGEIKDSHLNEHRYKDIFSGPHQQPLTGNNFKNLPTRKLTVEHEQ